MRGLRNRAGSAPAVISVGASHTSRRGQSPSTLASAAREPPQSAAYQPVVEREELETQA